MPIATPEQYAAMLDGPKAGSYAFPAVNVSSSKTLNAALRGLFEGYEGVLRVDGGVGNKKACHPRTYGRKGEASMAARVVQACEELGSAWRTLAQIQTHAEAPGGGRRS